jgi:GTPase
VEVYDRPAVILEIFRRHARTKEAQLQVELARPSACRGPKSEKVGDVAREGRRVLSRDRAPGSAGPNQRAATRAQSDPSREQIERRRHREGLPKVAIVGYTNAGKSSLMRAITSSEVFVADQLFATLDITVRALQPETQPRILVSDTVGFIRNLPHDR